MDSLSLVFLGAMLVVMWLFIIRPQTQQAKKSKEFQEGIEKGARVVTTGGIHGRVLKAEDTTVMLEIDNNTKIKIERSAISMDLTQAAYSTEKKAETEEAKA
ncbi:MAG TPA: preprotein translocase subunit YajC [Chitinophagales bacterium]|nr:preprotein translocase subunit YajC [Chitinophagales bacterium]